MQFVASLVSYLFFLLVFGLDTDEVDVDGDGCGSVVCVVNAEGCGAAIYNMFE